MDWNVHMDLMIKNVLFALLSVAALIRPVCVLGDDLTNSRVQQKHSSALDNLSEHLRGKGFSPEEMLSHPQFEIYEDIVSFYKKAPEKKGWDTYGDAVKRGDTKEAERLFNQEFTRYRRHIGLDKKKETITKFIEEHAEQLELVEESYGIPREIIAAVIGMESHFGKITGRHYAVNVYVSMYVVNYRKKFALSQLEELLRFSEKNGLDVFTYRSSYAGAIGYMQFLPYSLNRWFVGNNVFDMDDSITSVANYLAHFKKRQGTVEKALYRYNPSKLYVSAVLELADYARL